MQFNQILYSLMKLWTVQKLSQEDLEIVTTARDPLGKVLHMIQVQKALSRTMNLKIF